MLDESDKNIYLKHLKNVSKIITLKKIRKKKFAKKNAI